MDDFQSFINSMIKGSYGTNQNKKEVSSQNFDSTTMCDDNFQNYSNRCKDFWNNLLINLHDKVRIGAEEKYHYGIRNKDFPENYESFVEMISKNIDLDEKEIGLFLETYLKTRDDNSEDSKQWNLSIERLINLYQEFYQREDSHQIIPYTELTIGNIKKADAGYSFNDNSWLMPDGNNSDSGGETYSDVRGADKILGVLNSDKNLQFTINKGLVGSNDINRYLRLIMPEYKRNLEIEDINRNFWVIGQNLTALYAFLFEDSSPLPTILSGILDEIVQLWENLFYLWLAAALLSQEEVKTEVKDLIITSTIDINNYESVEELLTAIWEENTNLIDKYNGVGLVIFPEIKSNNYMKNYYSKAIYPGVIIYDNTISNPDNYLSILPFSQALVIDLKEKQFNLVSLYGEGDDENE